MKQKNQISKRTGFICDKTADDALDGDGVTIQTHNMRHVAGTPGALPSDVASLFARIAPRKKAGRQKK